MCAQYTGGPVVDPLTHLVAQALDVAMEREVIRRALGGLTVLRQPHGVRRPSGRVGVLDDVGALPALVDELAQSLELGVVPPSRHGGLLSKAFRHDVRLWLRYGCPRRSGMRPSAPVAVRAAPGPRPGTALAGRTDSACGSGNPRAGSQGTEDLLATGCAPGCAPRADRGSAPTTAAPSCTDAEGRNRAAPRARSRRSCPGT